MHVAWTSLRLSSRNVPWFAVLRVYVFGTVCVCIALGYENVAVGYSSNGYVCVATCVCPVVRCRGVKNDVT